MRVGIVTFNNAYNYGAILQALALKYAIGKLSHSSVIIDYHNVVVDEYYKFNWRRLIGGLKSRPWNFPIIFQRFVVEIARQVRKRLFKKSIINLSAPVPIEKANVDALVFGSDQIWNEYITGHDTFYYGNVENFYKTKLSYAASLGFGDNEFLKKNQTSLSEFKAIGVRESSLKKALLEIGIESELNADPTLLLTKQEWEDLLDLNSSSKNTTLGKYVLVYAIRDRNKGLEVANRITKDNGYRIIEINSFEGFCFKSVFSKIGYYTPIDFVRLIKNAHVIVTDSFHGTAFSIIFNKPFISIKLGTKSDDRISSLVTTLGLESHFLGVDMINEMPSPLEASVVEKLANFRNTSLDFLKSNLDDDYEHSR